MEFKEMDRNQEDFVSRCHGDERKIKVNNSKLDRSFYKS